MLVRWCPNVVSMSCVLQFTVIWGAEVVSFGAQNVSVGINFCTLGHHRAIQGPLGAQEGIPWGPGFDFCRFWVDFGTAFREMLSIFGATFVFLFHACLQVMFI